VTGHIANSTVNQANNTITVTLSDGIGNARATADAFDAEGNFTASPAVLEPGQDTSEGRDTIVTHQIELLTDA
jgi:hypothetical protein